MSHKPQPPFKHPPSPQSSVDSIDTSKFQPNQQSIFDEPEELPIRKHPDSAAGPRVPSENGDCDSNTDLDEELRREEAKNAQQKMELFKREKLIRLRAENEELASKNALAAAANRNQKIGGNTYGNVTASGSSTVWRGNFGEGPFTSKHRYGKMELDGASIGFDGDGTVEVLETVFKARETLIRNHDVGIKTKEPRDQQYGRRSEKGS